MAVPEESTAEISSPKHAIAVVVGIVFVDLLGFGVVIPVLPYYVRSFAVSDAMIGLLAASYSLLQFLAAPTLGRLSDERGRRPVILLSLAGSAAAWTVFGVAGEIGAVAGTVAGLATLFASRMLAGAMGGNIAAANAYVAADAALPEIVPTTQYSLPSFLAAGLSLLALVLAFRYLEEPDRRRGASERVTLLDSFRRALADPSLRGLVIAFFLVSVAFSGVQAMFIPFAADVYGYGATQVALFLSYIGALGALNQGVLVGRLSKVVPPARLAVVGAALLAAALAMLPFSPDLGRLLLSWVDAVSPELAWLLVAGAVLSLGNGLLGVSLSTLVSTGASAEQQGSAFGVTQGAGSLGRTVGPPLMGVLYVATYWSPFVVGALVVLPVLALLAGRVR